MSTGKDVGVQLRRPAYEALSHALPHMPERHTTHSDSSDLCRIFDLSSKPVRLPCEGMTIIVLNATAGSAQAASPSALDY